MAGHVTVKNEAGGNDHVIRSSYRGSAVNPYALIDQRTRGREQCHALFTSISFDEA